MKHLFPALVCALLPLAGLAQNVGIGTNSPNASAALEVNSTSRGLLMPRMTTAQRIGIAAPATGLLVYQTDGSAGFYYNTGTPATPAWVLLGATGPAGGDLTGSYPNPTVATGAIGTTKLADGAVTTAKLAANAITSSALADDAVTISKLAATGTANNTTYLRGDNTWTTPSTAPSGAAGGALNGTYPSPSLADNTVTNAKLADDAVGIAELSASGTPSSSTFLRGDNTWAPPSGGTPSGTAGGALTGTYPNPSLADGAVATVKLADNAVNGSKLADNAVGIAKLSASGTPSSTTYLRGDNTWATVSGGSGTLGSVTISANGTTLSTANQIVYFTGAFTASLPANPPTGQIIYCFTDNANATINANGKNIRQLATNYPGNSKFTDIGANNQRGFALLYNGTHWLVL